jgi:hypothetical protein
LRPRLTTGLPFSLAHTDASACRHTFPGWVAGPCLVGSEVAVLRPHVASSLHVMNAAYSRERGGRITQLQYLLLNYVNRVLRWSTSNFLELRQHEVRIIHIPRTSVNTTAAIRWGWLTPTVQVAP